MDGLRQQIEAALARAECDEWGDGKRAEPDAADLAEIQPYLVAIWPFVLAAVAKAEKATAERVAKAIEAEAWRDSPSDDLFARGGALLHAAAIARAAGGGTPEQGEAQ